MTAPTTPEESPEEAAALTTLTRVNRVLGRTRPEEQDDPGVVEVVEAVVSLVPTFATPGQLLEDGSRAWTAHQKLGATYLAARLYRRRDSPGGMVSFVEGGGGMVAGNWPDVAMLLGLGSYAVGRVG